MEEFVYEGPRTKEISFPLGGIGSGCIGLSGDGRLIDWEIFNRPNKGSSNGYTHFAVRAEKDGEVLDARTLQGDFLPPYTGSLKATAASPFGSGAPRNFLAGAPHFRMASFRGEFPLATVALQDDTFPGAVTINAFNPFIPVNDKDSSIPGAFFEIEIHNSHATALTYTVCVSVNNPVPSGTKANRFQRSGPLSMIGMTARDLPPNAPAAGDITIATDASAVSYQEYWHRAAYKGGWVDDVSSYWRDLTTPGKFANRSYRDDAHGRWANMRSAHCLLAAHLKVDAGSAGRARFLLAWNFPVYTNYWNPAQCDPGSGCCSGDPAVSNTWHNYYATLWQDSRESAQYGLSNWDRLYRETVSFKEALFSSTLPTAVIDAISANLSILKTPTVLRLQDGTFYGFEGCHPDTGCCEGSCTHVWNYAYALPFLFPRLERSMREADYRHNLGDDGAMSFRIQLPLGRGRSSFRPCADGQFGGVVKVYRDWKISGDTDWLARLWPALKQSIAFAWSPENRDRWDHDKDGVLEGRQHHTLDTELFGPSSWLTGFYLAALKAAGEMAQHLGDSAAAEYHALFRNGKQWVDENLFNGEYYHQRIDLRDKSILEPLIAAATGAIADHSGRSETRRDWDEYWDALHGQINYQVAEGCGIDQVVAQWHANISGLGEIFDQEQRIMALKSIYRYNFVNGLRQTFNPRRVYSLNDESGVLICSYPRNKPVTVVPFAEETMSGFEYQVAGHMIQEGLVDEGIEIVEAIRDRYDGEKRNPWNEMECGSNYARSMASYSLLLALSGFEFDMTRGEIGFHPKRNSRTHRYFWCLHTAWGTVAINPDNVILSVLYGSLELRRFHSSLFVERDVAAGTLDGRTLQYTKPKESVILAEPATMSAGSVLRLELQKRAVDVKGSAIRSITEDRSS